jgi:hypothetical protein
LFNSAAQVRRIMARNEFGPYYRSCGWVLGDSGLWACDFGAAGGIDLLAARSLFTLSSLHLAELATREIMADVTIHCYAQSKISRHVSDSRPDQTPSAGIDPASA